MENYIRKLGKWYSEKSDELFTSFSLKLQEIFNMRQGWIGKDIQKISPIFGKNPGGASSEAWFVNVEKVAEDSYKLLEKSNESPSEVTEKDFERIFEETLNRAVIEETSHMQGNWGHYKRFEFDDEDVYEEIEDGVNSILEEHSDEILYPKPEDLDEMVPEKLLIVPAEKSGEAWEDLKGLYDDLNSDCYAVLEALHNHFDFLPEPSVKVGIDYGKEPIKEIAQEITEY